MASTSVWASATDTPQRFHLTALARAAGDARLRAFLFLLVAFVLPATVQAGNQVFLEPGKFMEEVFDGEVPAPKKMWLTRTVREEIEEILTEPVAGLSLDYWRRGDETAWILESVGKERPITVGVAVGNDGILRLDVLVYREDRGWEVRYPFFTDQFRGAQTDARGALTQRVDGITGATLSVRALKRIARAALYLHRQVITTPPH